MPGGTGDLGLCGVDPSLYASGRDLARGGMGRIRVARDRRLGRDVAIKELLINAGDLAARFEREARVTARLQHPAIVSVYEAGTWPSGEPFFAMKLVAGRSFDEVIADASTLDARIALVPNALAVADAMAYAHSNRVIHRDLKPKNVLVGEFGETVVVDWGLAKDLTEPAHSADLPAAPYRSQAGGLATEVGEVMGTPAYMPPEQARGENVDERADVYALGALLFQVLSGRAPVEGRTTAEVLANVLDGTLPRLGEVQPGVPPDLVAIVTKAMARRPDDRYPSARELADDLRRFQTGQLVGAHQYSTAELVWRWLRRHRAIVAVVALALVTVAIIATVAVSRVVAAQHRAEEQRGRALANKAEVETMLDFMVGDLRAQLEPIGRVDVLGNVAHQASDYLDRQPPATTSDDVRRRALARGNLGRVLLAQGDAKGAFDQMQRALALAYPLVIELPSVESQLLLGAAYSDLATVHKALGHVDSSLAASRSAVLALSSWPVPTSAIAANIGAERIAIAESLIDLGDHQGATTELTASLSDFEKAGATPEATFGRANAERYLGAIALSERALADAEKHLSAGAERIDRMIEGPHPDDRAVGLAGKLHLMLGRAYMATGEMDGAERHLATASSIAVRAAEADPANADKQRHVSDARRELCALYTVSSAVEKAAPECHAAVSAAESALAMSPDNATSLHTLIDANFDAGSLQEARGDHAATIEAYRAALTAATRLASIKPSSSAEEQRAEAQRLLGQALLDDKRTMEAVPLMKAAIETLEQRASDDLRSRNKLGKAHLSLASALLDIHDTEAALVHARSAEEQLRAGAENHAPENFVARIYHANALEALGDAQMQSDERDAALRSYRAALAITDELARTVKFVRDTPEIREDFAKLAKKVARVAHTRKPMRGR